MRYEISCEVNGSTGSKMVVAASDDAAIERFRAEWSEHGDEFSGSCWISGRWS